MTGPTAKARAAKARTDAAYAAKVRAKVARREMGMCRIFTRSDWTPNSVAQFGACSGGQQWCHMEGHRRFETRGLPPEQRHSTAWTLMLCAKHHADYDARRLRITGNADGPLEFTRA